MSDLNLDQEAAMNAAVNKDPEARPRRNSDAPKQRL